MSENNMPETESESYPVEPHYHPIHKVPRKIYDFLASSRLAMLLLVVILVCCLIGVTYYRGQQSNEMIFGTIWFNAILVLLVINVACCFFGRIWGRKVTVISFGMILFHLSFVAMFIGIVYNSLYCFRGDIRLTEGESLPNGDRQSYDRTYRGRFFSFSKFKGDTTLVKLLTDFKVDGKDKRVAYQIAVGTPESVKEGIIYVTKHLNYNGAKYFPDKQGYSILTVLYDKSGKELYGAYIPLQTQKVDKGAYTFVTGSKTSPERFPFPELSADPKMDLLISYSPSKLNERRGDVLIKAWPLSKSPTEISDTIIASGKVPLGTKLAVGDNFVSVNEVRYWVGMRVAYEPGQPIVLTSLWVGLAGMIITTFGRIRKTSRSACS